MVARRRGRVQGISRIIRARPGVNFPAQIVTLLTEGRSGPGPGNPRPATDGDAPAVRRIGAFHEEESIYRTRRRPPPVRRAERQAHGRSAARLRGHRQQRRSPELVAEHGSPLYVFSEAALRWTSRDAHRAFRSRYPDVQFAWSYKTNYLKAVCAVFHQEGAIAEVVSDFEYEKARGMGVPGRDIIFNGPYKPAAALERAADERAKIQIDHFDELRMLRGIAAGKERPVEAAIRVYMDSGVRPVWSKFGFNADSGEAATSDQADTQRRRACAWSACTRTSARPSLIRRCTPVRPSG